MSVEIPSLDSLVLVAKERFNEAFNREAKVAVFAPGRVNLIGEHTDYNDGFVLPMALPLLTVIAGIKTDSAESIMVSTNQDLPEKDRRVQIVMPNEQTQSVFKPGEPKWANYVKGVLANYKGKLNSFQAVIHSSVPTGGGLSSSAALEVATYIFLDALNGINNDVLPTEKALACQKAEHEFAGMPCGIMDQFVSILGKKENALLIDCRNLSYDLIPFLEPNLVILITNSNVKHELTGSEYSSRRDQCKEAAKLLNKNLRDSDINDLIKLSKKEVGSNEVLKRARHVISEIKRTKDAAEALKDKNFEKFGELMIQSHNSLKGDFEVSCSELDQLVELALEVDGVLGSRMTGGGFGGCTVTMVYSHSVNKLMENIKKKYNGNPTFYVCKPSDGAQVLKL